jgi:gamma-glutamylcyclotransferase (GGCT)/AIG2-like uncharacterized protein YtfP
LTDVGVHLPFFVYGTLLPGEANFGVWRNAILETRLAALSGASLYDLGYFPMAVEDGLGEVRGMAVYIRSSSYRTALLLLDQLEGVELGLPGAPGYRRARRVVRLMDGAQVVAWVYLGSGAHVAGLEPIGPDWKTYVRSHVNST